MANEATQTHSTTPNPPQQNWHQPIESQTHRPLPVDRRGLFPIGPNSIQSWDSVRPTYQDSLNSIKSTQHSPPYDRQCNCVEINNGIQRAIECLGTQIRNDIQKAIDVGIQTHNDTQKATEDVSARFETWKADYIQSVDRQWTQFETWKADHIQSVDRRWTQFSTWAEDLNEFVDTRGAATCEEVDAVYRRMDALDRRMDALEKYVSERDVNSDFTAELREIDTNINTLEGTMESNFSILERRINAMEPVEQEQALSSPKRHQTATPGIEGRQDSVGTMGQEGLGKGSAAEHEHAIKGDMATNAIESVDNYSKKRKLGEGSAAEHDTR